MRSRGEEYTCGVSWAVEARFLPCHALPVAAVLELAPLAIPANEKSMKSMKKNNQ
jgi:hypothetical protein